MARKQLEIPGTERPVHDDVHKAAEAYREVRDERMQHSKREKQKKLELIAVMKAHKLTRYKYDDEEGEELLVTLDEEPKCNVRKTGEAEAPVGEGVESIDSEDWPSPSNTPDVSEGLINNALKDDDESDAPTPITSAKGKRAKKPKR